MRTGIFDLGSFVVRAPVSNKVITTGPPAMDQGYLDGFEGIDVLTIWCNFVYGSAGSTCSLTVQTTFDDTIWIDIARFDFTRLSASKVAGLAAGPKAVTGVAVLPAEGVFNQVLGVKFRAKITSTGTY